METQGRWQDRLSLMLGIGLFFTPFFYQFEYP